MYLAITLIFFIILFNFLLWYGLKKIFQQNSPADISQVPVSVVVAARNEQRNIKNLITQLNKQEYSPSEILIVDDYSSDFTYETVERIAGKPGIVNVIRNYFPQGKKSALTAGIKEVSEEYILITDADCIPEKNWAGSFSAKFSKGFDLLFGIAPYARNRSAANKISCFENLKSFMLSIAALKYNLPYSAAARSFGFKKSAFTRLNGYANTMEVPFGDDGLLIREAVKQKMRIGAVTGPDSFVLSETKTTLRDYLNQRKRHTRTSFYYSYKVQFFLTFWHLVNLIPLFLFLLSPMNWLFIFPLIIKIITDVLIISSYQGRFGYKFKISELIYLQMSYEIFVVIHFFNALTGKAKWK